MIDSEITPEASLQALSQHDVDTERPGPHGFTRRKFLAAIGAAAFTATTAREFFGGLPEAWAAPLGTNDGVLVTVTLYGGYDGLNVVVPYTNGTYYSRRPGLAIEPSSVLPINDSIGLHNALPTFKSLYDAGNLALLQGVGYTPPDLSHFTSMKIWMRGWLGSSPAHTGWIGRWLDGLSADQAELASATLATVLPLHLVGANRKGVCISPDASMFGVGTSNGEKRMFSALRTMGSAMPGRGPWHDMHTATLSEQLALAAQVGPTFTGAAAPTGGQLTRRMTAAARLINADLGLRVIDASTAGFDTHEQQAPALAAKLGDLDAALASFFSELAPQFRDRVTVLVSSEFGRTIGSNSTAGTDHGTVNPVFVIGSKVNGGLYGQMPSLTALDRNGRLIRQIDFRSVYSALVDGWLGGGGSTVLGGSSESISLFSSGPGPVAPPTTVPPTTVPPTTAPPTTVAPTTVPPTTVPPTTTMAPDTTAAPTSTMAPATTMAPTTTVPPTTTMPPTTTRPPTTTVPPSATLPVVVPAPPSTTVPPPAAPAGTVPPWAVPSLTAEQRQISSTKPAGYLPIQPFRMLDTRTGLGGLSAPLGAGEILPLVFTGVPGMPSDAVAVILNLTVVRPTADTYLLVWSGRQPRPLSASTNVDAGTVKGTLVMSRLGSNSDVYVYNNKGRADVVVDVVGFCSPSSDLGVVAIEPQRIFDTRDLNAPLGAQTATLPVSGIMEVPANAEVVAMNVTATDASKDSFLSVWPTHLSDPGTSNVNVNAGNVAPNLVLTQLDPTGQVNVRNAFGSTNVVVDVLASFATGAPGRFVVVDPLRVLDTRSGIGTPPDWRFGPLSVPMLGIGPIPESRVTGVVLATTCVNTGNAAFVTVGPKGDRQHRTSNLNVKAGGTASNLVLARLGHGGEVTFRTNSKAAHLIADVVGYITE